VVTRPTVHPALLHRALRVHPALRRRCAAVTASVLVCGGLATFAVAAAAVPQPTVSQVQAKIDKLTTQENVAIQQYDQAAQELASARQQLAVVNREVSTDRAKFRQMRAEIAQIATTAYESGNMSSVGALLTSDNPQAVLSQASVLLQLSSDRSAQVNQFIATARQLAGAQQMNRRTETAITALDKQRLARKQSISKAVANQQATLATLTAQQQATVATVGAGGSKTATDTVPTSSQAGVAVAFAFMVLNFRGGTPYVSGGNGPPGPGGGYDCSGLVTAAWAAAGIGIPRTTYGEAAAGYPTVPESLLQPGDLILFAGESHVGMYVGGGQLIDAPQLGMDVEEVSLSSSWYSSNYDYAVRP
jgi:cell wall-associated NlpC family hydrolase